AACSAGPAPQRAAPQRVARRSDADGSDADGSVGDGAAAAAEPERHAGAGQADRVPGAGPAQVSAGRGGLARGGRAVVDGLDVVAVQVAQEHPVVAGWYSGNSRGACSTSTPAATAAWCTASTAARSGALKATWSSLVSVPVGGPSQNTGWPSAPPRPTTMVSPYEKRMISRIPIAANVPR